MEDERQKEAKSPRHGSEKSEAVRSRWTPKPEQILILESIFNSGMVNPPKDETVRIRKLLEKFGAVGDANVFYWFQNRRSRSRRRQRQMMQQAAATAAVVNQPQPQPLPQPQPQPQPHGLVAGGAIQHDHHHNQVNLVASESATSNMGLGSCVSYDLLGGSSSSCSGGGQQDMGGFFSGSSPLMGFPEIIDHTPPSPSLLFPPFDPNLTFQTGYGGTNISAFITVFINGIATELPKGPIDMKTVFGEDVMLVHSSGIPILPNDFGFLMQNLQHGESYYLVSKSI
ncbi:WUSCHEL-related homeobox 11 [Vigna radiata var. radiata]|uniref:WUSCHEL-related homeobox 11 n=1 Tax=Vigna radiata var. radiata TaxID=3916 RepID=A0A1S3TBC6_VIGRR|nr:WUSCHEL-related homeobox 11 [Vigna radiata var. radiata]